MPSPSYRPLFVVGCPRSGTTWLQLLLAHHPRVATAPETQIFAYYLDHFQRQWREEHDGDTARLQGRAGLSRLLSQEEFEALCRLNASTVLEKIAAKRPDASIVMEKSPRHALHAEFIRRLFPDALFLNVVRDPRDVVTSLMAAARSWGRSWAPPNAIDAARMWREHILAARRVSGAGYREVRYERLTAEPVAEVQGILAWLGLPAGRAECEEAVAACELSKLREGDTSKLPVPGERSPREFFRSGQAGGWREQLGRADVRIVEHVCAGLMDELGYERTARVRARPLRIPVHDALLRVRESVDWQLQRLSAYV